MDELTHIECLVCKEPYKLRKIDKSVMNEAISKLNKIQPLFCKTHSGVPIVYICKLDQKLLCTKCILEPKYADKLSFILQFQQRESNSVAVRVSKKWKQRTEIIYAELDEEKRIFEENWNAKKEKFKTESNDMERDLKKFEDQDLIAGKILPNSIKKIFDMMTVAELAQHSNQEILMLDAMAGTNFEFRVTQFKLQHCDCFQIILSYLEEERVPSFQ